MSVSVIGQYMLPYCPRNLCVCFCAHWCGICSLERQQVSLFFFFCFFFGIVKRYGNHWCGYLNIIVIWPWLCGKALCHAVVHMVEHQVVFTVFKEVVVYSGLFILRLTFPSGYFHWPVFLHSYITLLICGNVWRNSMGMYVLIMCMWLKFASYSHCMNNLLCNKLNWRGIYNTIV